MRPPSTHLKSCDAAKAAVHDQERAEDQRRPLAERHVEEEAGAHQPRGQQHAQHQDGEAEAAEEAERLSQEAEQEEDRVKYSHKVARDYLKRFADIVKASSRDATVYFNGRRYDNLAEDVAQQGYRGLMRNRAVVVPGLHNKIVPWLPRLLPRDVIAGLVYGRLRRWEDA